MHINKIGYFIGYCNTPTASGLTKVSYIRPRKYMSSQGPIAMSPVVPDNKGGIQTTPEFFGTPNIYMPGMQPVWTKPSIQPKGAVPPQLFETFKKKKQNYQPPMSPTPPSQTSPSFIQPK